MSYARTRVKLISAEINVRFSPVTGNGFFSRSYAMRVSSLKRDNSIVLPEPGVPLRITFPRSNKDITCFTSSGLKIRTKSSAAMCSVNGDSENGFLVGFFTFSSSFQISGKEVSKRHLFPGSLSQHELD